MTGIVGLVASAAMVTVGAVIYQTYGRRHTDRRGAVRRIGQHRIGCADRRSVGRRRTAERRHVAAVLVEDDDVGKRKARLADELLLPTREAPGLRLTGASPGGGQVQDVILARKIP